MNDRKDHKAAAEPPLDCRVGLDAMRVYFNDFIGEEVKTYERRIAKEAFEAGWRYAVKHACAGEK